MDSQDEGNDVQRVRGKRKPPPDLKMLKGDGVAVQGVVCSRSALTLIRGGRDELKWARLMFDPSYFSFEEFEYLVEVAFPDRLSPADAWELLQRRVESRQQTEPSLESNALLALMVGDEAEYERLFALLDKRNGMQIEVIHGGRE